MSQRERLTRQELSWLLTQEARGAAERLRKGVQILIKAQEDEKLVPRIERTPGSDRPITLTSTGEEGEGLDSSLDMLDTAMLRLAHLTGPTSQRRRGRVELAALLWEIAPDAKVQLEPGTGTSVFADEAELRRMLHVLLGAVTQAGVGGAQIVSLRREGDEVKLGVALGPDTAPISPAERGWLSRMAIRYGGRYELDGASECLIFPAEEAEGRQEVRTLRKELEAAKMQGEAYARELAAVFSEPSPRSLVDSFPPPDSEPGPANPIVALAPIARITDALYEDLRAILAPLGAAKLKSDLRGDDKGGERGERGGRGFAREVDAALARGAELLAVARWMAHIGHDGEPVAVDLAAIAREEADLASVAYARHGVALALAVDHELRLEGLPSALRAMVAEMLDRALRASPRGGEVRMSTGGHVEGENHGGSLAVERVGETVGEAVDAAGGKAVDEESGIDGEGGGIGDRQPKRGGERAALAFLGEIAHAHRMAVRVTPRRISVELPLS